MTPPMRPHVGVTTAVKLTSSPSTTNPNQFTATFTTRLSRSSGTPGTTVDVGVGVHRHFPYRQNQASTTNSDGWQNIQTQREVVVDKETLVETSFDTPPNQMYRLSSTVRTLADRCTWHYDGIILIVNEKGEMNLESDHTISSLEQQLVRGGGRGREGSVGNSVKLIGNTPPPPSTPNAFISTLKTCVQAIGESHTGRDQFVTLNIRVSEYPLVSASGLRYFKEELKRQNVFDKKVEFSVEPGTNYALRATLEFPNTYRHGEPESWLMLNVDTNGNLKFDAPPVERR